MRNNKNKLQEYYMTCEAYFLELSKKDFDHWFSTYYSTLKTRMDGFLMWERNVFYVLIGFKVE
jgi:hypothetical protein